MTGRAGVAWLFAAAPGIVALVGLVLPNRARRLAAGLGIAGATVALAAAVALATMGGAAIEAGRRLVDFGGLPVTLTVRVDGRAALVAVAVAVVALAVQVYSVAYLAHDDRYPPYAAQVSLFTAAMMLVVVSGDLIVLLVGWEVMGICSYLLIGHDRTLPEAPRAAVKAFLVTRVGDVGFLLGIALLGLSAGSFRIADVLAAHLSPARLTVATLLLLAGVAGKSAQFPLHTWLPDAMAGPTPISALIHAATMVAAGVYVVTRLYPLFLAAPATLAVLGVVAAVTMLLGALAATAQDDIKRVLAWSTVSQIAYMSGALAVGAAPVALFHLLSHAAFKALLFLAAGCVIHAVGTNSMARMGGLRRSLPVTFGCLTIGLAALAGVPPFAGFWSKDSVLAVAAQARAGGGAAAGWVGWLVWLAGLATALVTAWYATRLWLRVFFGTPRAGTAAHDAPPLMRWPVVALAVPSALLGFAGLDGAFARRLGTDSLVSFDALAVLPLACLVAGAGLAWWAWRRAPATDPVSALGRAVPVFANAFYLDAVQDAAVVRPALALARVVRRSDESIVDGTVEATGHGAVRLGTLVMRAHRGPLSWAAGAALGGAVLAGVAAVILVSSR
ncbi:MAG: NADH-quinone oxidoreductase subunit [Micromonosporaceae bacterium]